MAGGPRDRARLFGLGSRAQLCNHHAALKLSISLQFQSCPTGIAHR